MQLLSPIKLLFCFAAIAIASTSFTTKSPKNNAAFLLQNGDIFFINSAAPNAQLIDNATNSKYNHCGILIIGGATWSVLEVTNKVTLTPFDVFVNKSVDGKVMLKRLKKREDYLNDTSIADFVKIRENAYQYTQKIADNYFSWNDSALYSSELVYKFYKDVLGVTLCDLQTLKDFDTQNQQVNKVLKKGYGNNFPFDEKAVSPQQLYNSKLLTKAINALPMPKTND